MNAGFIFGLIGALIGIGSVVVGVTTRLNHISHINAEIGEIKEHMSKIDIKIDKNAEDIAYMKGKNNGRS